MFTIDFYYWNYQCPYNLEIINMLTALKDSSAYVITLNDISSDISTAQKFNMYSPTLLVFNKTLRWNGPISLDVIHSIAQGNTPERRPYKIPLSSNEFKGSLKLLTEDTVYETCTCCSPRCDRNICSGKASFIKSIKNKYSLPHLGILNFSDKACVGGAEFIPSLEVPYAIPKGEDIAFLTCSYTSDDVWDYRSEPLRLLEASLPDLGFSKLVAIASEEVLFPNGTLEWFIDRGYEDLGLVYCEERDSAFMHIVEKQL